MDNYSEENAILATCLQDIAKGDRAAFTKLYELTSPKLYAILCGMVHDDDFASDILQHVFMSVWKNAGSFDPAKGKAFTWLLVVSRNRAIDKIRTLKTRPQTSELCETFADEHTHTDKGAKQKLLHRVLKPHLAALPENIRSAVIMNVVHGYSAREIGEKTNTSPNTVKSWIRRALKSMRDDISADKLSALL